MRERAPARFATRDALRRSMRRAVAAARRVVKEEAISARSGRQDCSALDSGDQTSSGSWAMWAVPAAPMLLVMELVDGLIESRWRIEDSEGVCPNGRDSHLITRRPK